MSWTSESAIKELEKLIADTRAVADQKKASSAFTRWYLRVTIHLEEVFGGASKYLQLFRALRFQASGSFVIQSWDLESALDERNHEGFVNDLNKSIGIFQAAIDELLRKPLEEVYHGKNTPKESSTLIKVLNLGERQLRKIIRTTPHREKEIQDAFENLLIGADIPYRREHPHIPYSSKNYIPDFSFEKIDLALDIKLCAKDSREKELIAEINDDIMAYKTQFGNIMFVVYDVGMIRDVDRFSSEFTSRDDVILAVVKH